MSYGFGHSSLWYLAELIHAPWWRSSAFASSSAAEPVAPGVAAIIIVPNIKRGGRPCHQVPAMGIA
jgi:hypothetical protein